MFNDGSLIMLVFITSDENVLWVPIASVWMGCGSVS